jgi:hypothetical protein
VPGLVWLTLMDHSGNGVAAVTLLSLVATGRAAMVALDRTGVNRMWPRLAWIIAAAIVGIAIWGLVLSAGGATYGAVG